MSASADADKEGRKLFLGGVSFDTREDDLRADFSKYGELEDLQLPMGHEGKHKGFAFITYRKAEDCSYAANQHHEKDYMGRRISAKVVVPRSERDGGGGGRERPADWDCPKCGANVFGSKSACFKCGEPKPGGGGRGGYDRRDDRGGGRYDDRGGRGYDDRDRGRHDDRGGRDYDDRDRGRHDDRGGRDYDRRDDRGRDYRRRSYSRSPSRGRR